MIKHPFTGQQVSYKPKHKRYSIPAYIWLVNPDKQKCKIKRLDTGATLVVAFAELTPVAVKK